MFGFSLVKTAKLNHLYSEASKLAIENVRLNKTVAKRDVIIRELYQTIDGILVTNISIMVAQNKQLKRLLNSLRPAQINVKKKR